MITAQKRTVGFTKKQLILEYPGPTPPLLTQIYNVIVISKILTSMNMTLKNKNLVICMYTVILLFKEPPFYTEKVHYIYQEYTIPI